jgi:hypothetical protein
VDNCHTGHVVGQKCKETSYIDPLFIHQSNTLSGFENYLPISLELSLRSPTQIEQCGVEGLARAVIIHVKKP